MNQYCWFAGAIDCRLTLNNFRSITSLDIEPSCEARRPVNWLQITGLLFIAIGITYLAH